MLAVQHHGLDLTVELLEGLTGLRFRQLPWGGGHVGG
jgi:hypothetical protein